MVNNKLILKDFSTLNHPKKYSNDCYNKQDVNNSTGTVGKKSDCPGDDKDDCDDVQKTSHGFDF